MASVETSIWLALKGRLETLPGGYDIAWPNEDFEQPTDANGPLPYVIVDDAPNEPNRFLIGSDDPHDRLGILQLSFMWPVSRKISHASLKEVAAQIGAHFPTDLKLPSGGVTARIYKASYVAGSYRDDAFTRTPISIYWQTYA